MDAIEAQDPGIVDAAHPLVLHKWLLSHPAICEKEHPSATGWTAWCTVVGHAVCVLFVPCIRISHICLCRYDEGTQFESWRFTGRQLRKPA